ncbi:MAG: hypothetical protein LBQ43_04440, partial [Holosporales bacterium]|nr:hypothetical protein [Holosporales bacterium]
MQKYLVMFFLGAPACLAFHPYRGSCLGRAGTGFIEQGPPASPSYADVLSRVRHLHEAYGVEVDEGRYSPDSPDDRIKKSLNVLKSKGLLPLPKNDSEEVRYAQNLSIDKLESCVPQKDSLFDTPLRGSTDLERRSFYFQKVSTAVASFSHYVMNRADRWIYLLEKNTVKNKIQYRGSLVDLSSARAAVSSCRGVWDAALIYAEGMRFFLLAGLADYASKMRSLYFETLGMGTFVPVDKTTQLFASSVFARSLGDMHALAGKKGFIIENPREFGIGTIPLNVRKELGTLDGIVSEAVCKDGLFPYPSLCHVIQVRNDMVKGLFADVMDALYVIECDLPRSSVSREDSSDDMFAGRPPSETRRGVRNRMYNETGDRDEVLGVGTRFLEQLRVKLLELSHLITACQGFDGRVSLFDRLLIPTSIEIYKKMEKLSDDEIGFIGRYARSDVWRSPRSFRSVLGLGVAIDGMVMPEYWGRGSFDSLSRLLAN